MGISSPNRDHTLWGIINVFPPLLHILYRQLNKARGGGGGLSWSSVLCGLSPWSDLKKKMPRDWRSSSHLRRRQRGLLLKDSLELCRCSEAKCLLLCCCNQPRAYWELCLQRERERGEREEGGERGRQAASLERLSSYASVASLPADPPLSDWGHIGPLSIFPYLPKGKMFKYQSVKCALKLPSAAESRVDSWFVNFFFPPIRILASGGHRTDVIWVTWV